MGVSSMDHLYGMVVPFLSDFPAYVCHLSISWLSLAEHRVFVSCGASGHVVVSDALTGTILSRTRVATSSVHAVEVAPYFFAQDFTQ